MTGETPYKINPTHIAYTVRDFTKKDTGETDSSWLKIGVAWLHKDGHGFDVQLEAFPVNGRVVLRTNDDRVKELHKQLRRKSAD
ncbi:hypothetical protein [Methylovulum psychrotolerans]|uniref:Uncharacterized protein n=1 Tax=Methylovulum psychrotolerans TaxID=1704499 RepID=A0A2S5CG03_9GAMM|nr:hypothetical protein [Methylovulum psychrotolerans]POZ49730.1 hypothetical protein AADEFJLK_04490 [Methylovulum psychrotolerans]